jgi:protocatechuate 3,4-dioxygenase beta subunit
MTSLVRRRLLAAAALLPVFRASAQSPAPSCGAATPSQMEGPFFRAGAPQRASLVESGASAPRFVLVGQIFDSESCRPVPRAVLEFWHTDERGDYDNRGYRYRGQQLADEQGRYRLETIVPGPYPGRTRHIHVKVRPPGGRTLTTQLYFPDDPGNRRDRIYRPELEITIVEAGSGRFDFVV